MRNFQQNDTSGTSPFAKKLAGYNVHNANMSNNKYFQLRDLNPPDLFASNLNWNIDGREPYGTYCGLLVSIIVIGLMTWATQYEFSLYSDLTSPSLQETSE